MYDNDTRLASVNDKNRASPTTRSKTPSPIKIDKSLESKTPPRSPLAVPNEKATKEKPKKNEKKVSKPEKKKVKNKTQPPEVKAQHPNAPTDYQKRFVLRIELADELKDVLNDDHDFVVKQQKIVTIPVKLSVRKILKAFSEKYNENTEDFEMYFNNVLSAKLLYKFERPMLADFLRKYRDKDSDAQKYPENAPSPAEIYGFNHLVRYTYHLDQVLCEVETDYNECLQAINMLQKLANYLKSRVSELHRSEFYHETAPEYHRRAQS